MDVSTYFPIWKQINKAEQAALSTGVRKAHYNRGNLIHTGGDCMGLILENS